MPESAIASIVDLAAAVARRFEARSDLAVEAGARVASVDPVLARHDPVLADALQAARHVIVLLLDGFGERQLETLASPDGPLVAGRRAGLRSVFPSSTGPALTSFATGRYPATHANPGWFCWEEALQKIVRTLPMDVRGEPGRGVDPADFWDWRSASLDSALPVFCLQPHFVADSAYTRHAWAGALRMGYRRLHEIPELVAPVIRATPRGSWWWIYLPHYDATSHESGWCSDAAAQVVRRFETLLSDLLERLKPVATGAAAGAGTGAGTASESAGSPAAPRRASSNALSDTLVVATADHGFIDVPADRLLRLEDFPCVQALLARPLSGEPRVAYCQPLPGLEQRFEQQATAELGFAFEVHRSADLIAGGWFGPGPVSPRLASRIGSHTLIARENYALIDQVDGETPTSFIGMHGGIHPDELAVPVIAFRNGVPLAR